MAYDEIIYAMDKQKLLSKSNIDTIYSELDELERTRLIAVCAAHAKELKIDKEFNSVIRRFNKASDELANEYKRNYQSESNIELDFNSEGKPLQTIDNFLKVLENDLIFHSLCFNELSCAPEHIVEDKLVKWTDADDAETRHYIEKKYKFHQIQKCDDALRILFSKRKYHPVKRLIESIIWDGKDRVCNFLSEIMKCENTPYTHEISRLIFAGGINRIYEPGCKFDDMIVLIGTKQGEGKSTIVRWLAMIDEFFTEVTEIEGQKGMEALEGAWICEIGELLALTKSKDVEAVKSYLSRQVDRYRKPFDRRVTDHPRQCIFIGTTNKEQFLTDKTGNRRFYPVKVRQSGYELFSHEKEIKEYIRQCWAEALILYKKGELKPFANYNLVNIIKQQQISATEDDWRIGLIENYLLNQTEVCVLAIWKYALNNDFSNPTKKDSNEIAQILNSIDGWENLNKMKRFKEFGMQRYWIKKETSDIGDLPF